MAKRKILLIEDDEIDQRMIISQLPDFDISCSQSMEEAAENLSTDLFDIVLLDLNLPDSSGINTYVMIRAEAEDTPIIVLSGMDQDEIASQAIRLGAQDFVSKDRIPDKKRFFNTIDFAIQRSKLAMELKKAEALTREQSDFKSRFLAQFSHEIRTPLNAVIGMAHLMEPHVQGEAEDLLRSLQIGANRLFSIVDDILDMSKIESGELGISLEMVNVRNTLESVIKLYGKQTDSKGIFLIAKIAPNVPQKIKTDPKRFCQVLTNLLSNAVKFTQEGSIFISVDYQKNQQLRVNVVDTGPGMSKQDSEKLFKPFIQVGEQAGKQGTGLGLSICKKIVRVMGGDISVDTQLGFGTTFSFTIDATVTSTRDFTPRFSFEGKKVGLFNLPRILEQVITDFMSMRGIDTEQCTNENMLHSYEVVIHCKPPQQLQGVDTSKRNLYLIKNKDTNLNPIEQIQFPLLQSEIYSLLAKYFGERQKDLSPRHANFRNFSDLRILVADDDQLNRQVIKKMLSRHAIQIKTVSDGSEVLEIWQRDQAFDLILMDCSMPIMDGFQATRKLRELECPLPIIALTAHAFEKHKKSCESAGMNGFLTKPINVVELMKILEDLQKHKLNSSDYKNKLSNR
ncbi:MAG: response regulator [Oligoflexales bacterium]